MCPISWAIIASCCSTDRSPTAVSTSVYGARGRPCRDTASSQDGADTADRIVIDGNANGTIVRVDASFLRGLADWAVGEADIDEVSDRQRKQMTTLSGNVASIGVDGKFDDCQALVKQAFADPALSVTSSSSVSAR